MHINMYMYGIGIKQNNYYMPLEFIHCKQESTI